MGKIEHGTETPQAGHELSRSLPAAVTLSDDVGVAIESSPRRNLSDDGQQAVDARGKLVYGPSTQHSAQVD